MTRSTRSPTRRQALLFGLAISIGGCKPRKKRVEATGDQGEEGASSAPSSRAVTTSSVVTTAMPSSSSSDARPTVLQELDVPVQTSAGAPATADVGAFLAPSDGAWQRELPADLGAASETAPFVQAPLPGLMDWTDAESFRVPSPGWRVFKRTEKGVFLASPDKHGDIVVHLFRESREIQALLASSRTHGWEFQAPIPRTVGSDAIPALIGHGRAKSADNKDVTVLYSLMRGEPNHLLVLCAAHHDTGGADLTTAFAIMTNVKRRN